MRLTLAKKACLALVFPRVALTTLRYALVSWATSPDAALLEVTDIMTGWKGLTGVVARRCVLRRILGRDAVAATASIQACLFSKHGVCVGEHVFIGFNCSIGMAEIGDNCLISDGAIIMSGSTQHKANTDGTWTKGSRRLVKIGKGAWIGAGAIIMADVGENATVGAGSVVTKPVEPGTTVVGIPAARAVSK